MSNRSEFENLSSSKIQKKIADILIYLQENPIWPQYIGDDGEFLDNPRTDVEPDDLDTYIKKLRMEQDLFILEEILQDRQLSDTVEQDQQFYVTYLV